MEYQIKIKKMKNQKAKLKLIANDAKAQTEVKTATTSKTKNADKKADLKSATATVIASKALTEVKYNYPADCLTTGQRKAFRTSIRAKLKTYEKKMESLKSSTDKEAKTLLKETILKYNEIAGVIRKDLKPLPVK